MEIMEPIKICFFCGAYCNNQEFSLFQVVYFIYLFLFTLFIAKPEKYNVYNECDNKNLIISGCCLELPGYKLVNEKYNIVSKKLQAFCDNCLNLENWRRI